MRAGVEADALGANRARGLRRPAERERALLVEVGVLAGEIEEVQRVDERGADAGLLTTSRNASRTAGSWLGKRQARLGCAKSWTASAPISTARPMAPLMPPPQCAPISTPPNNLLPWPSASAWRRARRDSCISGTSARRSSTGSSPVTRAASSACASRTRTRAARSPRPTEQIQESLRWLGLDWDGPVTYQLDPWSARGRGATAGRRGRCLRGRRRYSLPHARRGHDGV